MLDEAISFAKKLIARDVDLNLMDKCHGNTPFWYFCQEALKKRAGKNTIDFIAFCMKKNPIVDSPNYAGLTVKDLVEQSNNVTMKKVVLGEDYHA